MQDIPVIPRDKLDAALREHPDNPGAAAALGITVKQLRALISHLRKHPPPRVHPDRQCTTPTRQQQRRDWGRR